MDALVKQLIEKHKLDKNQAVDAILMVADYLKSMNPGLQIMIDKAVDNDPEQHRPQIGNEID